MSKEHAYAYEAGYRDGSIHYELEHCPACKNVADLQEALAENAKLREDVDRLIQAVEDLHDVSLEDRLVQMENENARLREYVTKLEVANLDVTARLTDYIGQYDPTDAFVAEVKAENAKLREACAELLKIAERHDPEWLHWPEMHEELRKLRVEVDDD